MTAWRSPRTRHASATVTLAALLVAAGAPLAGQPGGGEAPRAAAHILIDKPVRAGGLTLFPDLTDPKAYYYISDKPRLAVDPDAKPQFSFLRWVENVRSAADQAEARDGEGGGIVHALVELSVSKEQVRDAQRELQRTRPGAKIVGYVPFSSGTFGLISSFKDPKTGNLSTQVVGMGKAPLLDGEKAAVSIQLTKLGAKVLWESFQTPTPDISFSFEMELQGYHSPLKAKVVANWDQIYEHEAFAAGLATTFLTADINAAFDELRQDGAIKISMVGDDAAMNKLVDAVNSKLMDQMFAKSGSLDPAQLKGGAGAAESLGKRAAERLDEQRDKVKTRNDAVRVRNDQIRGRNEARARARRELDIAGDSQGGASEAGARAASLKLQAERARADANALKAQLDALRGGRSGTTSSTPAQPQPNATASAGAPPKKRPVGGASPPPDAAPPEPPPAAPPPAPKADGMAPTPDTLPNEGKPADGKPTASCGDAAACQKAYEAADARAKDLEAQYAKAKAEEDAGVKGGARSADRERLAAEPDEEEEDIESLPSFSVMATWEMRKVRQTGTFSMDFEKFLTGSITTRFDENIGNLRRLMKEKQHFREVNLDDPLYQQREIVAMVDGYDAKDFGEWINFVTVQLRKKHANGAETTDEVRVDRKNFNATGNAFKLLYGWNGDNDRNRWLDYEYRTTWSFFGGQQVERPWQRANAGAISLTPPYERRKVTLEADPQRIAKAGVRSITARLYYTPGGAEQVKQVTLDPGKQQLSADVEVLLPAGAFGYGYEVVWRLPGNKTVSSGRQETSEGILFIDEVPTGGP